MARCGPSSIDSGCGLETEHRLQHERCVDAGVDLWMGADKQQREYATTTKPSALPRKQHAKACLKSCREEVWSTAQGEPHRNRKREHPLSIRDARQDVVELGQGPRRHRCHQRDA